MQSKFLKLAVLASALFINTAAQANSMAMYAGNDLSTNKVHAPLITPVTLAKLNSQQGWPSVGTQIANMSNIISVVTAGHDAWALGVPSDSDQYRNAVAFYNGANWAMAESITDLDQIVAVMPMAPDNGGSGQAFAVGIGKVAYFDGSSWQPAQAIGNMQDLRLLTSAGHAWAIGREPTWQVSSYNPARGIWSAPAAVPELSQLRGSAAENGTAYLLGSNAQNQLVLLRGDANNVWHAQALPVQFHSYQQQLGVMQNTVYVALNSDQDSVLLVSHDQGSSWQSLPYHGGILLSHPSSKKLWEIIDGRHVAVIDLAASHPAWRIQTLPAGMGGITMYSDPSGGQSNELCVESDLPQMTIACYDSSKQTWLDLPPIAKVANRIDAIAALGDGNVAAFGVNKQNQAAAFYLHQHVWQSTVISGMRGMVENFSHASQHAADNELWLMGQD